MATGRVAPMVRAFGAYGLVIFALVAFVVQSARGSVDAPDIVVPTTFESGHFYAVPKLANGKNMRLMLDTGGGTAPTMWISESQAEQLGIRIDHECEVDGQSYKAASPVYGGDSRLPDLSTLCRGVVIIPDEEAQGAPGQV